MKWLFYFVTFFKKDGSERVIDSLSLIDAVMPDVVETRKQQAAKEQQVKTEPVSTNGEEMAQTGAETQTSDSYSYVTVSLRPKRYFALGHCQNPFQPPIFIGIQV